MEDPIVPIRPDEPWVETKKQEIPWCKLNTPREHSFIFDETDKKWVSMVAIDQFTCKPGEQAVKFFPSFYPDESHLLRGCTTCKHFKGGLERG